MSSPATGRLSLVLSVVALGIGLLALLARNEQSGRSASGPRADVRALVDESARRDQALSAEIEALRGELASVRRAVELRPLDTRVPVQTTAESADPRNAEALPPEARAADAPAEFEVRRQLIEGFHELGSNDREAALGRLSELARWGDAEALALIVQSLQDRTGSVRARALKELAGLDKANLPAYLRESIDDPSHKVREVVASHLDRLPDAEAGPLLAGLLRDADEEVVLAAIESLQKVEYPEARALLVESLAAKNLDVATRAAQSLLKLGDAAAAGGTIERILVDFADDDIPGRVSNVKRLRRLRAVNQLERILASDESLAVREAARDALVRIED